MKLLKRMKKSNNRKNSGFTLVELVIVMAIMGILGLAVAGFIGTSTKQYKYASKDVDLQYEAQLTMNQIGDLIIDAQKGVKYEPATVAAPVEVASAEPKDGYVATASAEETSSEETSAEETSSEETSAEETSSEEASAEETSSDSKLIIYNNDCTYYIIYRQSEHKIYLRKDTLDPATGAVKADGQVKESLMAENVTGFTPDLSEAERKNSVGLVLDFKAGDKKYTSKQNFTMRNKVPTGADVEYVEPVEPEDPISLKIYYRGVDYTKSTINATDEKGNRLLSIQLNAKVFGGENPNQNVIWTLDAATKNAQWTNVDNSGKVTIDYSETSPVIKVIATSVQDPSVSEYVYISTAEGMLFINSENTVDFNTLHVELRYYLPYNIDDFNWNFRVNLVDDNGNFIKLMDNEGFVVRNKTMNENDGNNIYYDWNQYNPKILFVKTGHGLKSNKYDIYIWGVLKSDPSVITNEVVIHKNRG